MKKEKSIPRPCPKCGCPLIAETNIDDGGPKGICCVLCGFHARGVEAWNKGEQDDGKT